MTFANRFGGLVLLVALAACRQQPTSSDPPAPAPSQTASAALATAAPSSVASAPSQPPVAAHGTVTMVLERVDAVCTNEKRTANTIGFDLFLQVDPDDAPGFKPAKDFVFCPKPARGTPRLGIWQNCSAFSSCRVVADETHASVDGAATGQVTVQCGQETVVLQSDGEQTTVRGKFGTRVLAPTPLKVAPLKTRTRQAWVDC